MKLGLGEMILSLFKLNFLSKAESMHTFLHLMGVGTTSQSWRNEVETHFDLHFEASIEQHESLL